MKLRPLPLELARAQEFIEKIADDYGLTFFQVVFEMVDYVQMNALAAYGGFPTRYPHYRFGMEYNQLSKSYEYGLHKIYEMVINNDPTYAYLLEGNTMLDQKLVMAHVYGHADFFLNNMYFAHTNRKMIDEMANHATRIRRYQELGSGSSCSSRCYCSSGGRRGHSLWAYVDKGSGDRHHCHRHSGRDTRRRCSRPSGGSTATATGHHG